MPLSKQPSPGESSVIEHKLDVIIRLLAAILTKGANKSDAIASLGRLQLSPGDIAAMVGVTGHHVSQTLYAERKKTTSEKAGRAQADQRSPEGIATT